MMTSSSFPPAIAVTPTDQVQRFLFDQAAVRGEWVQLHTSYRQVLARYEYPPSIAEFLGELMAAVALLTATIKLEGTLSIEVRGPQAQPALQWLMAECNTGAQGGNQLRALARFDQGALRQQALHSWAALTGGGQLVITLDPQQGQRYQGIVALDQPSLAASLESYFATSEQLPTHLWLAANGTVAGGLLLQQLPDDAQNKDPDAWGRSVQLAATVTAQELLELDSLHLLHRLYHEEDLRIFDAQPLAFGCTCSRERLAAAMMSLGVEALQDMLNSSNPLVTQCHFCNTEYQFSRTDWPELAHRLQ